MGCEQNGSSTSKDPMPLQNRTTWSSGPLFPGRRTPSFPRLQGRTYRSFFIRSQSSSAFTISLASSSRRFFSSIMKCMARTLMYNCLACSLDPAISWHSCKISSSGSLSNSQKASSSNRWGISIHPSNYPINGMPRVISICC